MRAAARVVARFREDIADIIDHAGNPQNPLPDESEYLYLWDWYVAISNYRGRPRVPVPPSEISAWAIGRGLAIEPFEFEVLLMIDLKYLDGLPKPKSGRH